MAGYIILLLIVPFISVSFLGVNAQLTACNTSSTCIANPQCGLNSAFSCNDTIFLCSSGFSAPDTTANKVDPGCNATSNATLCPYSCGYCCAVSSTNSTTNSTTASPTTASSVTCGSDSRCTTWIANGFCTSSSYSTAEIKQYCGVPCNLCTASGSSGSSGSFSTTCGNDASCSTWVSNGFCSSTFYTTAQKQQYCGVACKLCTGK